MKLGVDPPDSESSPAVAVSKDPRSHYYMIVSNLHDEAASLHLSDDMYDASKRRQHSVQHLLLLQQPDFL